MSQLQVSLKIINIKWLYVGALSTKHYEYECRSMSNWSTLACGLLCSVEQAALSWAPGNITSGTSILGPQTGNNESHLLVNLYGL